MAGKIKKLLENELVGGTQSSDVYPVTSVKAVYDEENERLDNIINRRGVVNISTNYNSDHIAEVFTLEQAIAKVPSKDRVLGFQGKFLTENGWETYTFIGDSVSNWSDKSNWIRFTYKNEVDKDVNELQLLNYFYDSFPIDGNLIDPNKVIHGYYFGDNGKLIESPSYGYIYLPMRGKSITINYGGGFKLSACDKYGSVTHTNTNQANTDISARTIQYQEGDEYAMVSVGLSALGKSASAEYGNTIPNYTNYGSVPNSKFRSYIADTMASYNTTLTVGEINNAIIGGLNISKGSVFGFSIKSNAEWSRLLLQFLDEDAVNSQRIDNITIKNGERVIVNSMIDIKSLRLYCNTVKGGDLEIQLLSIGDLLYSDIEKQYSIDYKLSASPAIGNLINPDKIIKGYYVGNNGVLETNPSYGYTYIPMRGNNITLNYRGGFILAACNKYGSITHVNTETAQVIEGRTLKYQEGDEYAIVSVSLEFLGKSASAEYGDIAPTYKPYNEQDGNLIKDNSIGPKKLDNSILIKKNLFNPDDPDYVEGYYLTLENNLYVNENYAVSGYIPFTEEMGKIILSVNGDTVTGGGGVGIFDIYKNKISISQLQEVKGIATWQEGVAFARFSINDYKKGNIQIEVGDVPTEYVSPNGMINPDLLPQEDTKLNIALSSLGNEADSVTKDTLNDSETLTLDNFPWHVKKRLIMSFSASITSFSSILIGKGLNQYRGDYLKIDSTNITQLHYESSESEKEKVAHGLSIDTFIKISLLSDNSGYLYVILQSKNGTFKYVFKSWAYEANYSAFVKSIGSTLTDLKFNAGSQDFKLPVWAFGDSYFGVSTNRWPSAIRDFGFFNFLIDGLAGQGSNGAYNDLVKCLQFGTPKYLLWCLGMNDADSTFKTVFDKVKVLCEIKGITLIAATIPTVPDRPKEIISQYVKDSGVRYIDFYKAMGANKAGTWYEGYLDTDKVHPTSLGAQAQAMQVLIDFPELMQYGLTSTESEIGDSTGDH